MPQDYSPSRRLVCRTVALAAVGLLARPVIAASQISGERADRIVVLKSARTLIVLRGRNVLRIFPIALGLHPKGPKRQEGDGRTPEGHYQIDGFNARSRFYRALHISYPNAEDLRRANAAGVEPGGNIEIHGLPERYGNYNPVAFGKDWTNGCIAVSNPAISYIWTSVDIGTPIHIVA